MKYNLFFFLSIISFGFRHNRVFGTARNTNIIPGKPVWDKSITKTKIDVSQRKPKSISTTQLPIDTHNKKSTENANLGLNKKSHTFPQQFAEKTSKNSSQEKGSASEPKTPVASSSHVRTKSTTPFYSALNCSKCRFDRLETSSYWVGQIKMAESVGKHFVASEFFRLALESHAEVILIKLFAVYQNLQCCILRNECHKLNKKKHMHTQFFFYTFM